MQATNQLLALQAKHSIQTQRLQLTQGRAASLELARESTRKGSKYGQFSLGQMYSSGHPLLTQTDEEEASCASRAAALFCLAIDQGFDGAQNFAGAFYFGGRRGYPQDIPRALHLFRLAAAQGSLDGQLYASACARFSR
jgi:TPR repeat protein